MISINLSDIAILNIRGSDYYYCIISLISKIEAIKLLQDCYSIIMDKEILTFGNIEKKIY